MSPETAQNTEEKIKKEENETQRLRVWKRDPDVLLSPLRGILDEKTKRK